MSNIVRVHRTKNGVEIPICSMDNQHLMNTAELLLKKLEKAKVTINSNVSKWNEALYGKHADTVENSSNYVRTFFAIFPHYFFEILIRNLEGWDLMLDRIRIAIERKTAIDLFDRNSMSDEEINDTFRDMIAGSVKSLRRDMCIDND